MDELTLELTDGILLLVQESDSVIHNDGARLRTIDLPMDNDIAARALAVSLDDILKLPI